MAKSYNKATAVSVYIRIRLTDGSQPYCPAIWETKKRLKPHSTQIRCAYGLVYRPTCTEHQASAPDPRRTQRKGNSISQSARGDRH
jgi:hypothetical protein